MLSKLRKASEKALSFLLNKRHTNMASRYNNTYPKVQELYELCKETLSPSFGRSSASMAAQKISSLLDTIGPADVGLKEEGEDDDRGYGLPGFNLVNRVGRWAQPITFLDVYECSSFTMCIFCFPTSAVIPLHDHPEMTVFSKVLYGSLHVKAYDWIEPPCIRENNTPGYPPVRLAKLAADKVLTSPCEPVALYPKTGGNLHCFTAITPCAVLDILTPPYREDTGRICSYYLDHPYSTFASEERMEKVEGNGDEYAWLMQIDTPDDLYMRPGKYTGPAIRV